MSNKIFPQVYGLSFQPKRTPQFKNVSQAGTAPGVESRIGFGPDPIDAWEFDYTVLRADGEKELEQIDGFFRARRGSLDSFLIDIGEMTSNPAWSSIVDQPLPIDQNGNAPLIRSWAGGYDEPIYELAVDSMGAIQYPTIKHNGVTLARGTDYNVVLWSDVALGSLNENDVTYGGIVIQLIASPEINEGLTADFSWMYRVRFDADEQEFDMFHLLLWNCQSLKLMGTRF